MEELLRELKADCIGRIIDSTENRAIGLAMFLKNLDSPELKGLMEKADVSLILSEDGRETLSALQQLLEENQRLNEISITDPLTGLFNVRHFRLRLGVEFERVRRMERPCSLIMIDLDRFKAVNDNHGHQAGDQLLRDVAEIIRTRVRAIDIPVRYGGDEFAVVLPDTEIRSAYVMAERIRAQIEQDPRTHSFGITGSIGLAAYYHFDDETMENLIERADQSMYNAKSRGGNQVWFFDMDKVKDAPTDITVSERDLLYSIFSEG